MSAENNPERGVRPETDVSFKCSKGHVLLARFPFAGIPHCHITTFPWDYSSGIVNGLTSVEIGEITSKQIEIFCPHCPEENNSLLLDTWRLKQKVVKARLKK